jgi:hypothetical protein
MLDRIFCISDALDEMDDDCFGFVARLAELDSLKPCSTKVLLTSRPLPKIKQTLRPPSVLRLKLPPTLLYPNMVRYADARLAALSPRLNPATEELIRNCP